MKYEIYDPLGAMVFTTHNLAKLEEHIDKVWPKGFVDGELDPPKPGKFYIFEYDDLREWVAELHVLEEL
jgi:hypothetical protein